MGSSPFTRTRKPTKSSDLVGFLFVLGVLKVYYFSGLASSIVGAWSWEESAERFEAPSPLGAGLYLITVQKCPFISYRNLNPTHYHPLEFD